mmetsp:Transcript_152136/g.268616  ORF Transcript_152136/g.268616 Transcript_152136/m.268616 type:complete len:127 (-) Transcript_152136:199-579(-)
MTLWALTSYRACVDLLHPARTRSEEVCGCFYHLQDTDSDEPCCMQPAADEVEKKPGGPTFAAKRPGGPAAGAAVFSGGRNCCLFSSPGGGASNLFSGRGGGAINFSFSRPGGGLKTAGEFGLFMKL